VPVLPVDVVYEEAENALRAPAPRNAQASSRS
jgi:hypothetical protein